MSFCITIEKYQFRLKLIFFSQKYSREASSKISEIINELGEASAKAQGLNKPVTTGQKLRNSDHIVYLLSEKTGKK